MAENIKEQRISLKEQLMDVDDIKNARQLGGYIGADGRRVKKNLLLRTARLSDISPETVRKLSEQYHVTNVVDFRMEYETKAVPDKEIPGAVNTWVDLFELDMTDPKNQEMMKQIRQAGDGLQKSLEYAKTGRLGDFYRSMLLSKKGQEGYGRFFQILLQNKNGATLWHCSYGKDRTGLAAALILYALGVDESVIKQDFLLTNEVYQDEITRLQAEVKRRGCEKHVIGEAQAMAGVKEEYFDRGFEAVKEKYGSIHSYINNQLGVSDEQIEELRKMYLE